MNKKTKYALVPVLLSLVLLLGACAGKSAPATTNEGQQTGVNSTSEQQNQSGERLVKDALGHEVSVPANPQRILASYLEDHLVALGVKPIAQWSVGDGKSVQRYLQYALQDVPTIPSELPYEAVISFEPDLIIMDSAEMASGDKYGQYAKIAPTYVIGTGKNNDWRQELLAVADILNKSEEGRKVLDEYERKASEAKAKLHQEVGEASAAVLWVSAKNTYVVHEQLSSGDVLYRDLGLQVPAAVKEISASATANWNPISKEKLAELSADYLFIIKSAGITMEEMKTDPIWSGIPAVKSGHVYEFGADSSWLYTGVIANGNMIDDVLSSILPQ
ncbi:ABC transporter substrate-binding protein [Paenibacillus oralis]|uniref:ABC transporter substrate-binding protein n=1 Tax=Paenibacillus oralis TaxID=2490856 RepID=A0A3P3TXJ3_9BACL|nr:ABC transporter substrate-binding protein [Paenibacillus oralis]RRJ62514.1 ABC transporter substrate-binding protein [Paenibacillus oralis]